MTGSSQGNTVVTKSRVMDGLSPVPSFITSQLPVYRQTSYRPADDVDHSTHILDKYTIS